MDRDNGKATAVVTVTLVHDDDGYRPPFGMVRRSWWRAWVTDPAKARPGVAWPTVAQSSSALAPDAVAREALLAVRDWSELADVDDATVVAAVPPAVRGRRGAEAPRGVSLAVCVTWETVDGVTWWGGNAWDPAQGVDVPPIVETDGWPTVGAAVDAVLSGVSFAAVVDGGAVAAY